MKGNILVFLFLMLGLNAFGQHRDKKKIHIIPQPVSVKVLSRSFTMDVDTRIFYDNKKAEDVVHLFSKNIARSTGLNLPVQYDTKTERTNSISFEINSTYDSIIGDAGYKLNITPEKVALSANKPRGLFYGVQSLKQLFPPEIESDTVVSSRIWKIRCVDITDYPQFKWRGLMLDVSRHFFTVDEVKEYIDAMAKYKFNIFHWHLTDDQGWRIEIKGLPKLTEIGAWRVKRTGNWANFKGPQPGEKATYGGYYTQEEIKEVVAYAKKRFISILPEIDVPGHSLALIAAYPNLSCTKKQYPVWPQYQPEEIDNVLCVANDSTWLILDEIFTQVASLFPFGYIHVGGDEANRDFWMQHAKDVALMKKEGLTTPAELQSYFEKKLEKLIIAKGKKLIGWDEILEGGLAPEATVMSWRGDKGGIKAAKMGHHVVVSPARKLYLSQAQGNALIEPAAPPRWNRLKEIYTETDILPKGVNPQMVLGGEACLWTEYVPNFRHAEYMTWPRALAASEVFWGTKTDWGNFAHRVEATFPYFKAAEIKYATSVFDPIISGIIQNDQLEITLSTEFPGLDIYYTFDGTNPDKFYPKYEGNPLSIPIGASEIRVVAYKDGKQIGHQINCPISRLEQRVRK